MHNCAWQQCEYLFGLFLSVLDYFQSLFFNINYETLVGYIFSVALNTAEYPCLYADRAKNLFMLFSTKY